MTMTYNNKHKHSHKNINFLIVATVISAFVIVPVTSAYAVKGYATHDLSDTGPTPNIYGIKSKYKVIDTTIASGKALHAPTWATLGTGIYREVGWGDAGSQAIHSYYAINGQKQSPVNYNISNNVEYTFEVSNINQDFTWDLVAPGILKQYTATPYDKATIVQTGYESSDTTVTMPQNHFRDQRVYSNNSWHFWTNSDGFIGGGGQPGGTYYVIGCGSATEQLYHTQHGTGSAPSSCS